MESKNNINQHKHLSESHSQNPFDLARENQDFQREYDNAQEFYRKRPFVERFKKYVLWVRGLQGIGHTFSALSLGAGGIFTVYNYLFSDSEISDFQTWLFVGIGVVIFILVVIAIEAGKGHFLAAAMKNKFEAANQLLGEKVKPSLRKWAFALVAISLIGSVFFGMMGTYYLATEKIVIDNSYQADIEEAKNKASQADKDTKAHYQKQIESKYAQIEQININIQNSCASCYTMRERMQRQINDIQESISSLEEKQRQALKDNKSNHDSYLSELEASNSSNLDQDSKKALGRGWILGVLTFFSDLMIVFCVWFIALYNDRLFREGKHIGAINEERMSTFSIDTIYLNDLYEKQSVLMKQLGRGQFLQGNNQYLLPTNQTPTAVLIERKKKKKKKRKKDKKAIRNPIGFSANFSGKTEQKIKSKKEVESGENSDNNFSPRKGKSSPNSLSNAENGQGRDFTQVSSKNMLLNLNPETPYNLEKTYDLSKSVKKQISQLRKAYLNYVKNHSKRPTLAELDRSFSGMSKPTIRKYIQMMQKDGQTLLRQRGELM